MSAIADRSGVGKPTIYLRWANRADLMVAAVVDLRAPIETDVGGSAREALAWALEDDFAFFVTGEHSGFLRSVLFESASDAGLAREFNECLAGPRQERIRAILLQGIADGEFRAQIDADEVSLLLHAPLIRATVLGSESLSSASLRTHLHVILEGVVSGGQETRWSDAGALAGG